MGYLEDCERLYQKSTGAQSQALKYANRMSAIKDEHDKAESLGDVQRVRQALDEMYECAFNYHNLMQAQIKIKQEYIGLLKKLQEEIPDAQEDIEKAILETEKSIANTVIPKGMFGTEISNLLKIIFRDK